MDSLSEDEELETLLVLALATQLEEKEDVGTGNFHAAKAEGIISHTASGDAPDRHPVAL